MKRKTHRDGMVHDMMANKRPLNAIAMIAEERQRQQEDEDWTPSHDDTHRRDELALAAVAYALPPRKRRMMAGTPQYWPWSFQWWKPKSNNRIRELVKAGALIVAEIERLQRKEASDAS